MVLINIYTAASAVHAMRYLIQDPVCHKMCTCQPRVSPALVSIVWSCRGTNQSINQPFKPSAVFYYIILQLVLVETAWFIDLFGRESMDQNIKMWYPLRWRLVLLSC